MKIKSIVDYPDARSILIYGNSGTGKTTAAATAPGPILFIDIEAGLTGLDRADDIDFALNDDGTQMGSLKDLRNLYLELISKPLKYKTIVIDSVTELVSWAIKDVMGDLEKQPNFGEWGKIGNTVKQLIRAYRDFPKSKGINLVLTALSKETSDEDKVLVSPKIMGSVSSDITAMVDAVLYTTKFLKEGKVEFKMMTRGNDKIFAKVRSKDIGNIVDPNMTKVLQSLNQKKEALV